MAFLRRVVRCSRTPPCAARQFKRPGNSCRPAACRVPRSQTMSFRTKLLLVVLLTIFASVSVVAYAVTHYTQAAFEAMDTEHTEALAAQFKKGFDKRGKEMAPNSTSKSA